MLVLLCEAEIGAVAMITRLVAAEWVWEFSWGAILASVQNPLRCARIGFGFARIDVGVNIDLDLIFVSVQIQTDTSGGRDEFEYWPTTKHVRHVAIPFENPYQKSTCQQCGFPVDDAMLHTSVVREDGPEE